MDRILEKKPFIIRYRNYLIAGVVFLAFLIYVVVNSMGGRKLRTEADKLSVETVRQDKFLEYVDAEGIVQPILTLKVNTREGGSVDKLRLAFHSHLIFFLIQNIAFFEALQFISGL